MEYGRVLALLEYIKENIGGENGKTIEQDIENVEKHQNDCCSGEHNHDDCNCHNEKVNNDHDHSKYVQDELKKKKDEKKVKKMKKLN